MIKVYLAGFCLAHLEQDHSDTTSDEPLCLGIRGICYSQGDFISQRLPITINLLRFLKRQLCTANLTLLEQHLLWGWGHFIVAFFGFFRASEFTYATTNFSP